MEIQMSSREKIRNSNAQALSHALDEVIARITHFDPKGDPTPIAVPVRLTKADGLIEEHLLQFYSALRDFEKVNLDLHIDLPVRGKERPRLLDFPGNFYIRDGKDYLENDAIYTKVVIDPLYEGIGIGAAATANINRIRQAIFRKYDLRLGVDRYFVNVIDSSKGGWTAKRMRDLGYTKTDDHAFFRCVYICRD